MQHNFFHQKLQVSCKVYYWKSRIKFLKLSGVNKAWDHVELLLISNIPPQQNNGKNYFKTATARQWQENSDPYLRLFLEHSSLDSPVTMNECDGIWVYITVAMLPTPTNRTTDHVTVRCNPTNGHVGRTFFCATKRCVGSNRSSVGFLSFFFSRGRIVNVYVHANEYPLMRAVGK